MYMYMCVCVKSVNNNESILFIFYLFFIFIFYFYFFISYNTLINTVHESLPLFYQYLNIRQRVLEVKELDMYENE
jgi:hypothetical protein